MGWVRGTTVGRGTTATVTLAVFDDDDDHRVLAAKSAPVSTSYSLRHEESILDGLRECPRIIPCFGHDVTSGSDGELLYDLLLEYFPRGSLHDNLRRSGGSFTEPTARRYARSILEGLKFVHGRGYVHCDVKLQNVLLCDDGDVKIADFGLARNAKQEEEAAAACLIRGTPMYMSPESVARREYETPMDIWSFGCAVAEMVSGRPPWQMSEGNDDVWALMMRIGFGDEDIRIPDEISEQGKDFLRRCLVRDPKKRWTADMLLDHPFLVDSATDDDCCCSRELLPSPKSVLHFHPSGDSSLCFSSSGSSEASLSSATSRIMLLATGHEQPDWWCRSDDDDDNVGWLSVREAECGAPVDRIGLLAADPSPDWLQFCPRDDGWVCVR